MTGPKLIEPQSTVVSMIHRDLFEEKPGLIPSMYKVNKGSMEEPGITHIQVAMHHVYLDDTRGSLPVRDASYEVARSIVEDYISSQAYIDEGCYPGLFWIPGKYSLSDIQKHEEYSEILIQAKLAHRRWLGRQVQAADDDYARYQKSNVVSDFQRRIAEILKLKPEQHPWMSLANSMKMDVCPGCGSPHMPGIEVCGSCKRVLNKETYDPANYVNA